MLLVLPAFADAPTISSTAPGRWLNGTDLNINIIGHYFPLNAANITVNLSQNGQTNVSATGITANSESNIIASFGVRSIHFGDWNLTVNNLSEGSNGTISNTLDVYNPSPTLSTINPSTATNESTSVPFILTGTGFFPTPVINLSMFSSPWTNITATNCQTINNTEIHGTFNLLGNLAQAGSYTVNLTNPDGNLSNTLPFTIYVPAPTISNVVPSSSKNNASYSNVQLTITGSKFLTASTTNATITNSTKSVQILPLSQPAVVSNSMTFYMNFTGRPVGLYNVTVTNLGPLYNNTTWSTPFQIFYPDPPRIISLNTSSGVNPGITNVQIVGSGFQDGATVVLNRTLLADIPGPITSFNSTTINCSFDLTGRSVGPWNVIVTNNDTQSYTVPNGFNIIAPPAPTASFFTDKTSGSFPLTVLFNDTSINNPTTWNWSFGDTNTAGIPQWYNTTIPGSQNNSHTYVTPGIYTAKLTVSNANGGNTTTPGTIITVSKIVTIGVFRNGVWYLRNTNTVGNADITFAYGLADNKPVSGHWIISGNDTPGVFHNGIWDLKNSNSAGSPDSTFGYGITGDTPVVGDWTGSGIDTVGVFRNGVFYLKNTNAYGNADLTFAYGLPSDTPIVGDWTGSGKDTVGVFRNGVFYLRNTNTRGDADKTFYYGLPGDTPLIGNWTGS